MSAVSPKTRMMVSPVFRLNFSMPMCAENTDLRNLIFGVIVEMKADGSLGVWKAQYIDDAIAEKEP